MNSEEPITLLRAALDERDYDSAFAAAIDLCSDWHGGQDDPLYGFTSSGDLEYWAQYLYERSTLRCKSEEEIEATIALYDFIEFAARLDKCGPCIEVNTRRFLEDDVYEGDPDYYGKTSSLHFFEVEDEHDSVTEWADEVLRLNGATDHSGSSWYADPNGSTVTNYATGEREEVTAYLYGFSDDERNEVNDLLDK